MDISEAVVLLGLCRTVRRGGGVMGESVEFVAEGMVAAKVALGSLDEFLRRGFDGGPTLGLVRV